MTQAEVNALQVGDMIAYDISDIWKITAFNKERDFIYIKPIATQLNIGTYKVCTCTMLLHKSWEVHIKSNARRRYIYEELADLLAACKLISGESQ